MSARLRRLSAAAALASGSLVVAACGTHIHTKAALPTGSAAISQAAHNAITVSPLPGTTDASPHTEISFLGGRGMKVLRVDVVASRTKYHAGRLLPYSEGDGESFLPARPFAPGETVAVYALVSSGRQRFNVGTIFAVASAQPPSVAFGMRRLRSSLRPLGPRSEYPREAMKLIGASEGVQWVLISQPVPSQKAQQARGSGASPSPAPLRAGAEAIIEQVDRRTGLVMWEWHSLGHPARRSEPLSVRQSSAAASAGKRRSAAEQGGTGALSPAQIRSAQRGRSGRLRIELDTGGALEISIHTGALLAPGADNLRSRASR